MFEVVTTSSAKAHSYIRWCLPIIFIMTSKQSCNHSTNFWSMVSEPWIYFCTMAPGLVIFHQHQQQRFFLEQIKHFLHFTTLHRSLFFLRKAITRVLYRVRETWNFQISLLQIRRIHRVTLLSTLCVSAINVVDFYLFPSSQLIPPICLLKCLLFFARSITFPVDIFFHM